MTGGLIFIAGLIVGGCIAVMLLGCLQINRINKYEISVWQAVSFSALLK